MSFSSVRLIIFEKAIRYIFFVPGMWKKACRWTIFRINKIVLNSSCAPEKVPEALKPLYAYLNDPHERLASSLTRRIDERVRKFNSDDWRRKYMTFEHMLNERERKGIERGRAEGHAAGRKESTREIARNLKALRLPIAQISEATGLSAAEIEAL